MGGKQFAIKTGEAEITVYSNIEIKEVWWARFEKRDMGVDADKNNPEEVVVSGDWENSKNWKGKILPKNLKYDANKKDKLGESDFGKSVKLIVKTEGLSRHDGKGNVELNVNMEVSIFNSLKKKEPLHKITSYNNQKEKFKIENNYAIIPVYLDEKWGKEGYYDKEKKWYDLDKNKGWYNYSEKKVEKLGEEIKNLNDQFYVNVSAKIEVKVTETKCGVPNKTTKTETISEYSSKDALTVWPQPALIIHADAELYKLDYSLKHKDTGIWKKSDIRPIPSNWKKEDHGYWYRLGRAYEGLGLKGKQIIKYIYTKRNEFEFKEIEVDNVQWRGSQKEDKDTKQKAEFEHPTPNIKKAADVTFNSATGSYFFFKVPIDPVSGAHEEQVFIHGTKVSEGCFLIGAGDYGPDYSKYNGDPTHEELKKTSEDEVINAIYVWDIMMQLKNDNYEVYVNEKNRHGVQRKTVIEKVNAKVKNQKYENGVVKISSDVTKDNATKLAFNYENLHETGLDNERFRGGKEDAELTDDERDAIERGKITPLDKDELQKFIEKYKNENKHPEYFKHLQKIKK